MISRMNVAWKEIPQEVELDIISFRIEKMFSSAFYIVLEVALQYFPHLVT